MTKIEWTQRPGTTGETWNPIRARNKETGGVGHFCTKVSAGCQNCYAAEFQKRFKNPVRYAAQDAGQVELFLDEKVLMKPLRWKKPRTVFVCSMTDLFYEGHCDYFIRMVWGVMALCPQHTFIVLTKRTDRMLDALEQSKDETARNIGWLLDDADTAFSQIMNTQFPLPNVWLGVSVEDQKTADERIPALLKTHAAVRFLSVEPLLGQIDLTDIAALDWVIVGGESGHNARPMHPDWARLLRDQCKAAGVPFFFKQWGSWRDCSHLERPAIAGASADHIFLPTGEVIGIGVRKFGMGMVDGDWKERGAAWMCDVGKKAAGRLLDGIEHNEWPEAKA